MYLLVPAVLIVWLLQFTSGVDPQEGCQSPQYLELGHTGTIQCYFREGFLGVFWYDSEDFANDEPILSYKDLIITGPGYKSGEFSIWPNGSLIINNVSLTHDHVYTAIKLNTLEDDPFPHTVIVITTATPKQHFPVITQCGKESQFCLRSMDPSSEISCTVQGARPMVELQWFERTLSDDKNIHTETNVTSEGNLLYTSRITTKYYLNDEVLLKLLVCKVISSPSLLQLTESVILVQRSDRNLPSSTPVVKYFQKNSKLVLLCTDRTMLFLVWSSKRSSSDFENIAFAIFTDYDVLKAFSQDIELGNTGSLVITEVQVQDEGLYNCLHGNGTHEDLISYEVVVYVTPESVYPVVEECGDEERCLLELDYEGNLTCTVRGIRPQVQLEWTVVDKSLSESITFENKEKLIKDNGDTFDVSLKTTYHTNIRYQSRITVQCKVSGKHAELFDLTRSVDLLFRTGNVVPTNETKKPTNTTMWLLVVIVTAILLVIFGIVIYKLRDHRRRRRLKETGSNEREMRKLLPPRSWTEEKASAKKAVFIDELKQRYARLYDSVWPIPYIREKWFSVDKVFVDCGIEFLPSNESGHDKWERMESYQCMFQDSRVQSRNIIVQGFPGYGKSTLTQQIAYDWCKHTSESPLEDVEILILLRLRKLEGIKSFYRAIKKFILPKNTRLSEQDIQLILQDCSSVVIILDGYDEYPDKDSERETDVRSIIERKMLHQCSIIITTRPSHFPKDYSSDAKRIRLLGFDEIARRKYILKSVTKNEGDAKKIEESLKAYPVLKDLCEAPLFFVMFAHTTQDREEDIKFNSITEYFLYMVKCFHTHMQNKTEDKALRSHYEQFQSDHYKLNKVAFENLRKIEEEFVLKKEKLIGKVGKEFYEFYVRIGIFMEEEVISISDKTPVVQSKTEVRFYHRLFHEWYAAHFLADNIGNSTESSKLLEKLDPASFPDVYRFTCGLKPVAAVKVIRHLDSIGSKKFKLLCMVEKDGEVTNLVRILGDECAEDVHIRNDDNILKQKSTLQLIKIASHHEIPITSVWLWYSFSSVDQSAKNIILKSGLSLPNLQAIKEIVILEEGREIRETEAVPIFDFVVNCKTLGSLGFTRCLLPWSFENESSLSLLQSRGIDVWWYPVMSSPRNHLNLESGRWRDGEDGTDISKESYHVKKADFRDQWSYTPWQRARLKQLNMDTSIETV